MFGKDVALPSAQTPSSNVDTVTSRCTKRIYDLKRKRRSELHGNVARQLIGKVAEVSSATDRHGDDISTSAIESIFRTVHSGRSLDGSVLSLKSKRTFQLISKKNSQRTKMAGKPPLKVLGWRQFPSCAFVSGRHEGKYFGSVGRTNLKNFCYVTTKVMTRCSK